MLYTDGRSHISPSIRQLLGDSRVRWEGDELVVETTNLTDKTSIGLNGNGLRHSHKMTIVERFKRVRPFTLSLPLTPLEGNILLPYDCHEGNLAILQSLGAERAEDRALADDLNRGVIRPRQPVQDGNPQANGGGRGQGGAAAPAGGRAGGAPPEGDQER